MVAEAQSAYELSVVLLTYSSGCLWSTRALGIAWRRSKSKVTYIKVVVIVQPRIRTCRVAYNYILEYSCNKCSNLIGQLEVHYFTYGPPERS